MTPIAITFWEGAGCVLLVPLLTWAWVRVVEVLADRLREPTHEELEEMDRGHEAPEEEE